jgi:hypothetical protein
MPRVFLSYSHDNEVHKLSVHGLAGRLAAEQRIEVVLDRDAGPGGPDEGWPGWSERQVREADRVLIACSKEYSLRYEGNDEDSERGRGTVAEARTIQQFLYESKGRNARFRVVLFAPDDADYIPHQLRAYHWFNASDEQGYKDLLAWLGSDATHADAPGPKGPLWLAPDLTFKLSLADLRPHFDVVRTALSGQSSKRIFLFEGNGASGKTEFLNELSSYADHQSISWTSFDLKGAPALEDFFVNVVLDLRGETMRAIKSARSKTPLKELVEDLGRLSAPVMFLFDTYDQASEEMAAWLDTNFLSRVRNLPAVIVVIAGRRIPEHARYPWRTLVEARKLEPIADVNDWADYVQRVHDRQLERHELETLTTATQGCPGTLRPLLDTLVRSRTTGA